MLQKITLREKIFNEKIVIVFIVVFASFFRLWQLGVVPNGVTNDEMGYIYNSYSLAHTGRNVFGEFLPFVTWINRGGFPFLPVPTYFSIPFFWLFGLSATSGRLPSALLGVLDVLLIYILVGQIFKRSSLALLSAFFLSISPWHLHFSRSAYDPNFALFFYLLAIVVFMYEIKKDKLPIWSSLCFLLAMFSYRGMNVIFLPISAILIWYGVTTLNMKRKQLLVFLAGISLILLFLLSVIKSYGKAYIAEAFTVQDPHIQQEIDAQIREAQGPLFIRRIFLNKPMYLVGKFRENYVRSYSPEFLFLYTEPNKIYTIWSRGRIYFFDMILIILGIAYLLNLNKKGAYVFIGMVLIGGLPGMIGGLPYSARNFFLSVLFPIFSAGGVLFLLSSSYLRKIKVITVILLVLIYAYLFGGYLFDYYGRYALYAGEAWFKSLKDLSYTVIENKNKYNRVIVGTSSFSDLLQYAFYAKINPSLVQSAWGERKKGANESFVIDNATFTIACLDDGKGHTPHFKNHSSVLYIVHESCNKFATPSAVLKDYAGNTIWKIYESK